MTTEHESVVGNPSAPARGWLAGAALLAILASSTPAAADDPAPPPAAPPAAYPPPGYPPPGYPPPGYAQPAPGPKSMEYDSGDPIPPGYHKESRIRTGLVIGGAITFGLSYVPLAILGGVTVANDCGACAISFIPVIGPWIYAGAGFASADFLGSIGTGVGVVFLVDAILQTGGAAMLIAGLAAPKTILVRNDAARKAPAFTIAPTPMNFGKNSTGLGIVGTF